MIAPCSALPQQFHGRLSIPREELRIAHPIELQFVSRFTSLHFVFCEVIFEYIQLFFECVHYIQSPNQYIWMAQMAYRYALL